MSEQPDVTVLPERVEGESGIYRGEVQDLVEALRDSGLVVEYQHDPQHRLWRELFGESQIAFSLAIAASVVGAAAWDAVKAAFAKWLDRLPPKQPLHIELKVTSGPCWQETHFVADGRPEDVLQALDRIPEAIRAHREGEKE